jgi:hypothetical protein
MTTKCDTWLNDVYNWLIVASTATKQNKVINELDKADKEIVLNCR